MNPAALRAARGSASHEFHIDRMVCGLCIDAVRRAVRPVAPRAMLTFELARRRLRVDGEAERAALEAALARSGYPPASRACVVADH